MILMCVDFPYQNKCVAEKQQKQDNLCISGVILCCYSSMFKKTPKFLMEEPEQFMSTLGGRNTHHACTIIIVLRHNPLVYVRPLIWMGAEKLVFVCFQCLRNFLFTELFFTPFCYVF